MAEITVEDIGLGAEPVEAPEQAEEAMERAEEAEAVEEPPVEVSFATSAGDVAFEAAPKKRGRPRAAPKPKAEPKKRGRPPRQVVAEPVYEPQYQQPVDINALLEPLFQAYIATSHMSRRNAQQQKYRQLFQGMRERM